MGSSRKTQVKLRNKTSCSYVEEVESGSSWTIVDVDWLQSRRFVPAFADIVFISSRPGLDLPFASTVT